MTQGLTNKPQKETGEGTIVIFPWAYASITQGTWVIGIHSAYMYYCLLYNSSHALNDQIDYKAFLTKGAWTCFLEGYSDTNAPAIQLLVDSTTVGQFYHYRAATTENFSPCTFNVTTTGLKTISFKCLPNFSDYYLYFSNIILQRAD